MAYPNEVFTVFSFLGFFVCLIPFPCHLKAWNIGICLYIFWASTGCLTSGINSIVWNGNAVNSAPVWCDIWSRFMIASSFGIPASSLCISRRLYLVQRDAIANLTEFNKNRAIIVDLLVGLGLPLLSVPIYYITQGHRFNIFEDVGCEPTTYNTWIAIVTISLPPLLIGIISAFYAIRTLISINKIRSRIKQLLTNHSDLTYSLYFRLMGLAGTEILFTVPITSIYLILNSRALSPWISWEDTHYDFGRVDQYPAILWRRVEIVEHLLELSRWLFVVGATLIFCFFGFAEEVRLFYRPAFRYLNKRLGIRRKRRIDEITFKAGSIGHGGDTAISIGTIDIHSTHSDSDEEKGSDKWPASTQGGTIIDDAKGGAVG